MPTALRVTSVLALLFLCALSSLFSPLAFAQLGGATLSGVIQDPQGRVVPDVEVVATRIETQTHTTTKTNGAGIYVFTGLVPGHYHLLIRKPGFKEIAIKEFQLYVQDKLEQNFSLEIGSISESMTVRANGINVNTTDATISTVIDRPLIENMPLNGNSLQTLFELTPGVITNAGGSAADGGGFSANGQRPTSNYLTIDGVSGNLSTTPNTGSFGILGAGIATSASGGTNGLLPVDAVEEFRMQTSSYSAEYGRTPGGQIEVRTRGGTNQYHGSLFENFRNQVMDSQDWFNAYYQLKQSPLRMNDFGGTVGGPILKNRLFFFVAHESLYMNQPQPPREVDVPDQATKGTAPTVFQPFLAVYPAGNRGPDSQNPGSDIYGYAVSNPIRDHTTSVRVDAELPKGFHAFFRINDAPSYGKNPGDLQSGQLNQNIFTLTSGLTWKVSTTLFNELTANFSSNNSTYAAPIPPSFNAAAHALSSFVDLSKVTVNVIPGPPWDALGLGLQNGNQLHQYNIVDTLSWLRGTHSLKLGVDYRHLAPTIVAPNFLGLFPDFTTSNFQAGIWDYVHYQQVNGLPKIKSQNTALFITDTWRARKRLTLTLGLRWDYNPPPSGSGFGLLAMEGDPLSPGSITLAPSGTPLYRSRRDNFAPRIGIAYSVRDSARFGTVIRGGGGIFFDTGQSASAGQASSLQYPYLYDSGFVTNVPYSSLNVPQLSLAALGFPQGQLFLLDPNLVPPRTYDWSLTIDQSLGENAVLSTSYVGNHGDKLLKQSQYDGLSPSIATTLDVWTNGEESSYNALQVQFRKRAAETLNVLASYTYAHALDTGSKDFVSPTQIGLGGLQKNYRADSDNDIRHVFSTAVHYSPKGFASTRLLKGLTGGWSLDAVALLQSAAPFSVFSNNANNPNLYNSYADIVPGVPEIISDSSAPGGKRLNSAAFACAGGGSPPCFTPATRDGTSPRNGYRLFGLHQFDLAASRSWPLWEGTSMAFRVDAFNVLNTPNFANVDSQLGDPTFGRATRTYAGAFGGTGLGSGVLNQVFSNGGARSLQLSFKIKF